MNNLIISLLPLAILSLTSLLMFGFIRRIKSAHILGLFCLLTAIVINSLFLIEFITLELPITFNFLIITSKTLWIHEVILIVFLIFYISINVRLQKSHNADMILGLLFLIIISLCLLFLTENFLIISFITTIVLFLSDFIFYFGIRRKTTQSLRFDLIRKIAAITLSIILNVLLYLWCGSNSINDIRSNIQLLSFTQNMVLFIGFLVQLMLIFNHGLFSVRKFNNYFGLSNIFHLRILTTIVNPMVLIIYIDIVLKLFLPISNFYYNIILFSIGLVGFAFSIAQLINETFGTHLTKSRNILKILGLYHNCGLNVSFIFLSFAFFNTTSSNLSIYSLLSKFIIILCIGTTIIWEAFNPVLNDTHKTDLSEIAGYNRIFPSFTILVLMAMFYLVGPGFTGFKIIQEVLEIVTLEASPIVLIFLWGGTLIYFIFLFFIPFTLGTSMVHIYFKPSTTKISEAQLKSGKYQLGKYIIGPILLLGGIILQILYFPSIIELNYFFL